MPVLECAHCNLDALHSDGAVSASSAIHLPDDSPAPQHVLVIDSRPIIGKGLCLELARDMGPGAYPEPVGFGEALIRVQAVHPKAAVVALGTSPAEALKVCADLIACGAGIGLVMLAMADWDVYLARAWTIHALAFVAEADTESKVFVQSVRRATEGLPSFSPAQLDRVRRWQDEAGLKLSALTVRELEVLEELEQRPQASNRVLGIDLFMCEKTIEYHLRHVFRKLGVGSRAELVDWLRETHALACCGLSQPADKSRLASVF